MKKLLFYAGEALLGIAIFMILLLLVNWYYNAEVVPCTEWYCLWDPELTTYMEGPTGRYSYLNLESRQLDTFRIVVVGDSVVFNGCPDVTVLQARLNELVPMQLGSRYVKRFNVVNAGQGATEIEQGLDRLRVLTHNNISIDMLFVFTGWNEHWYDEDNGIMPCITAGCYQDDSFGWLLNLSKNQNRIVSAFATEALLYKMDEEYVTCHDYFKADPEAFIGGLDHYNTSIYRVSLPDYKEALLAVMDEQRGAQLVFVTAPDGLPDSGLPVISSHSCVYLDADSYYDIHNLYMSTFREMAHNYSIPLLDLKNNFDQVPNNTWVFFGDASDPIHPNLLGNQYCTELYYQQILDELFNHLMG